MTRRLELYSAELQEVVKPEFKPLIIRENN